MIKRFCVILLAAALLGLTVLCQTGLGETLTLPDGLASMSELVDYVTSFRDPFLSVYTQHVQAYPANSDYALFFRDN